MWLSGQRHLCSLMASSLGRPYSPPSSTSASSSSSSCLCFNPLRRHGQQINKTQSGKSSVGAGTMAQGVCNSYSYLPLLPSHCPTPAPLLPPPSASTSSALLATDKCFVFFFRFRFSFSLFFLAVPYAH